MLREYEFTVITKNDLPDSERGKALGRYEDFFTRDGGEILKKDEWGSRKMAFPMKKQHRGFYTFYDFVGNGDHLKEVERLLRIDDNVLRYMLIKIGEDVDVAERKVELAKVRETRSASYSDDNE